MNTNDTNDPMKYCYFFHHGVCHVCKTREHLKRCSQCKSVPYCSKEHQKFDWKTHKGFCAAMTRANKECDFIAVTNFDDFLTVKKTKYRLLCEYLKRQLRNYEHQIWMFPRFCEICYSENVHLECEKCGSVFFCSEDHRQKFEEIHKKHCDAFTLNLEIGLYPIFNDLKDVDIEVRDIPTNIEKLPTTLMELVELYDVNSTLLDHDIMQKIRNLNCLSPIATILYGLEKSNFITKRNIQKEKLTIHIVGASMYEIGRLWLHMAELAFHWITNLIQIDFIIIGPELGHNGTTEKFTNQLCSSCKTKKRKTICIFHTQLYHNVVQKLEKPDVIVAFNSGIHGTAAENFLSRNDNLPEYLWTPSIKYLVNNNNVPLILTEYILKELEEDIKKIKEHGQSDIQVLVEPHRNPFSDGKPLRNFESQSDPMFYINGYMSVVIRI